jgi:putative ATPase
VNEMDLFESAMQEKQMEAAPLALRMRPRTLEEFVGQESIVGEGTVLRKAISQDTLSSAIFWGPPGTGKTTLARIVANLTRAIFVQISAVTSNVSEVRKLLKEAKDRLATEGNRTILFIDEIHRFNKAQQDALLPAVEEGTVVLIGATTENPYFEVNSPLISRSTIFRFQPLSSDNVKEIILGALKDEERGLSRENVVLKEDALQHILKVANGDARIALNVLGVAALTTPKEKETKTITLEMAVDASQKRAIIYDREGDAHYDTVSAFIKSMRGSDPDASIYWLARMIYAGEDPRFIARRMVIFASEDIGNADPQALLVATGAAHAVEYVGLPEAQLNLAQAVIYLATAPKSNAVIRAIQSAMGSVEEDELPPVPPHLRDSHYPGAKKLGHGKGYKYPYNYPDHFTLQDYLPPELRGKKYYEPSDSGYEKKIKEYLRELEEKRGKEDR